MGIYSIGNKIPNINPKSYIAPGAQIIGEVQIAEDTTVWFNAVLRGDNEKIAIGRGTNIQDNVLIHADPGYPAIIQENVVIGHNAILHGCEIMKGSLIGMGSVVLNGAIIGSGSIVAAGSLVKEKQVIESGVLVAGSPAKTIRKLLEKDYENMEFGVQHYISKGNEYRTNLHEVK